MEVVYWSETMENPDSIAHVDYRSTFHNWMLEKGNFDGSGFPAEPLSPHTANNRLKKIRRILVDIGFLDMKRIGSNGYEYSVKNPITDLKVADITSWFSKEFPILPDLKSRQRKADYIESAYKFGQFLHFDMGVWSRDQLETLKCQVRRPRLPAMSERKVNILGIEKTDPFIDGLREISIVHYTMCYLMRYGNMRYAEVINAKADLKSGTLMEDFRNDRVIIFGKGTGGLSQRRVTPFFEDDQKVLNDYLSWRDEQDTASEWLFMNQYMEKWSDNSGHFNAWLRKQGEDYGFSRDEVKLLTTHKIGRHGYGTWATLKGLPEKFIRDNMGIRNSRVLERYQNTTDDLRVEETRRVLKPHLDEADRSSEMVSIESFSDEEREQRLIDMLIRNEITQDTFKAAIGLLHP